MDTVTGNLISFDIGQAQLKMVWYRGKTVKKAVAVMLPDGMMADGQITSMDAMADFLRSTAKENDIPRGAAAVILPSSQIFTRNTEVPIMNDAQLRYNLPFEFKDYLEQEKRFYKFDYSVQGLVYDEQGDVKQMQLFSCAVLEKTLEVYRDMFHRAGFKLKAAIPEEYSYAAIISDKNHRVELARKVCLDKLEELEALSRIEGREEKSLEQAAVIQKELDHLDSWEPDAERCFVDLGHDAIRMSIYHGDVFVTRRIINIGMHDLLEILAEYHHSDEHIVQGYLNEDLNEIPGGEQCRDLLNRIAVEVMKAVNFYNYNNREKTLRYIYLSGGGSALKQIAEAIGSMTSAEIRPITELLAGCDDLSEAHRLYVKAMGCALQAQGVMA